MPKHEPVREAAMLDRCEYYTTCEVLREAYHLMEMIPQAPQVQRAKEKIRLAAAMAKATTKRLYKYEPKYLEDLFDRTEDIRNESS